MFGYIVSFSKCEDLVPSSSKYGNSHGQPRFNSPTPPFPFYQTTKSTIGYIYI